MKIQLRKNSWLGKELGHPTDIWSLMWGIIWRAAATVVVSVVLFCVVGFIFFVNYVSFHLLFDTTPEWVSSDGDVGFAVFWTFIIDIVVVWMVTVAVKENWDRIGPYWKKYVLDKGPRVEWVDD